jgi:hypothetical protein
MAPVPGVFDTPIQKLGLPLELNQLGVDFTLTKEPYDDILSKGNDPSKIFTLAPQALNAHEHVSLLNIIYERLDVDDDESPAIFRSVDSQNNRLAPVFKLGQKHYRINNALTPNSAYGRMFKITGDDGNDYILKVCRTDTDVLKKNVVSEALIQHIIYESTKKGNHYDCPYAMKIISMFKLNFVDKYKNPAQDDPSLYFGIIMEEGKPWTDVETEMRVSGPRGQTKLMIKICRMLHNLRETYDFTHGDLHCQNAFYKEDVVQLIDFGRSCLNIGTIVLRGENNYRYEPADVWTPKKIKKFDISYLVCSMVALGAIDFASHIIRETIGNHAYSQLKSFQRKYPVSTAIHAYVRPYLENQYIVDGIISNTINDDAIPKKYLEVQNNRDNFPDRQYVVNKGDWCYPQAGGKFRQFGRKAISRRKMKRSHKNKTKRHRK